MDSDQSVCDSSMLLQASLTMEDDIPTLWSADLREGLSMMDIQFSDIPDSQIQLVYSLYNTLSYPYQCNIVLSLTSYSSSQCLPL